MLRTSVPLIGALAVTMNSRAVLIVVQLAITLTASCALAADSIDGCLPITVDDASPYKPPRFEQYSVTSTFRGKPAQVDLGSQPDALRYRTMLTQQAASGPDFAGFYTVAGWGCGSSCLEFAIIDVRTGSVYFDKDLRWVSTVHVGNAPHEPKFKWNALRYRADSRLLVVLGSPQDDSLEGISYYEWDGVKLNLVRFIQSRKKRCDG